MRGVGQPQLPAPVRILRKLSSPLDAGQPGPYTEGMQTTGTTTTAPLLTTGELAELTNRLAAATARRVTRTGETFEAAGEAVLRDFTAGWPLVAAAMVAEARR